MDGWKNERLTETHDNMELQLMDWVLFSYDYVVAARRLQFKYTEWPGILSWKRVESTEIEVD